MIAWLTSTVGKTAGKWLAIAALIAAGYWKIYASGKAAAEVERVVEANANRREREKVDEKVSALDADDRRAKLRRWVRD